MEKSYTNYYIPLITPELKLSNAPIKHKGRIKLLGAKTSQRLDSLMPHGFADCAKENKIYKDLCSNFHIDLMTKDEIVEELQRALSNHLPEFELSSIERDRSMPDVSSISENMFEILRLRLHNKWSLSSIKAKLGVTDTEVKEVFDYLK